MLPWRRKWINSKMSMSVPKAEIQSRWIDVEQISSLPLQILLFTNVYVSVFWMIAYGNYVYEMVYEFGMIHQILTLLACFVGMPGEVLRLYLGYSGNLGGKVTDLAGFWILSALVQLPIQLYFTLTVSNDWIIVAILQYVIITLLIMEIPIGGYASSKLSKHQSKQYRIRLIGKMNSKRNYSLN